MKRLMAQLGFFALTFFVAQMTRADIVIGNFTALKLYLDAGVYSVDCSVKQTYGSIDYMFYPGGKMAHCYVNGEPRTSSYWCTTDAPPGDQCLRVGGS